MNPIAYFTAVVLLSGAVRGQTWSPEPTPTDEFDCPDNLDGSYPHPTDCTKYFVCTNGLAWEESCPAGLYFDPITKDCNYPEFVNCSSSSTTAAPTTAAPTTAAPTTEGPTTATPTSAAPTTAAPTTSSPDFDCSGMVDGSYPHPTDCTKYYVCANGVMFPEQCPDGLYFDPTTKDCNYPEFVNCTSTTAAPTTAAPTTAAPTTAGPTTAAPTTADPTTAAPTTAAPTTAGPTTSSPGFDCSGMLDGSYPHPTDCTRYYVCLSGATFPEQCPDGLWFDPALSVCNWPDPDNQCTSSSS